MDISINLAPSVAITLAACLTLLAGVIMHVRGV